MNRNSKRVEGTCNWFTNHPQFKGWISSTSLLYVTADPGCGKSVLSRYLVDEVLPNTCDNTIVCYFFFKDDFADQRTSLSAMCTLLHQLFTSKLSLLTKDILNKYRALGEMLVQSFHEMWEIFLAATAGNKTICVMDALDECFERDREQLIRAIVAFHNRLTRSASTVNLKFLLTSRPYDHIRGEFIESLDSKLSSIHLQGDYGKSCQLQIDVIRTNSFSRSDA
jgi:archaellum biogenesis ATPase FlaH